MGGSLGDQDVDFFTLFDHVDGVAFWASSEPGQVDFVSSGIEEIYGVSPETVRADFGQMIDRIHPEDRDRVLDGLDSPEEPLADAHEHRVVKPDGTVRWVHSRRVPIRDDDGTLAMLVGIASDITAQKRRERELELLNRIVRHDIRNDMAIILGWAELLAEDVDEAGRERLQKILASGEHIVELTEIAREFVDTVTSTDDLAVTPVSLRAVLENELSLRIEAFPHAEFRVPERPPDVDVAANAMLGSVFRNLLNNAIQHNDEATPVVELTVEDREEDVIVRVADNGPGIPQAERRASFERGVSGTGSRGTGIGLYLVQTLVEEYGGDTWIEDADDGSVFAVQLRKAYRGDGAH